MAEETVRMMGFEKTYKATIQNPNNFGFSTESNLTIAVVPRLWFGKTIPTAYVDDDFPVIVLPDKGGRDVYINNMELGDSISFRLKTRKKLEWVLLEQNNESPQKPTSADIKDDSDRIIAIFNLLWRRFTDPKLPTRPREELLSLAAGSRTLQHFIFLGIILDVKEQMRELRRTYQEIRVKSSTIRGRIDLSASIPFIASGSPERICITEEFSLRTPHYSALMTAFDKISALPTLGADSLMGPIIDELQHEASVTRSRFREIPSMSYGMAIRTLRTVPVPPQLRRWKKILNFAKYILEDQGGPSVEDTVELKSCSWEGSLLWEDILERIASRAYSSNVTRQPPMFSPWEIYGNEKADDEARKHPDIIIKQDELDIIIDAKYYEEISSVMSNSDYQMLGYALAGIQREKGDPLKKYPETRHREIFIAVPVAKEPENEKGDGVQDGEESDPDKQPVAVNNKYSLRFPFTILDPESTKREMELGKAAPSLTTLEIEFPSPEVYLVGEKWEDYFSRISKSLSRVIEKSIARD